MPRLQQSITLDWETLSNHRIHLKKWKHKKTANVTSLDVSKVSGNTYQSSIQNGV